MKPTIIKFIITISTLLIAGVHMIWPSFKIDAITATFIIFSIIPWLSSVFKSIELPGGIKVEYQDLQKIEAKARKTGLINVGSEKPPKVYSFQTVASSDPNLALAGLRIELERRLVNLAEATNLQVNKRGLNVLLTELNRKQVINAQEQALLSNLIGTLNAAVHGAKVDSNAAQWVLDVGPQILSALEQRTNSGSTKYTGIIPNTSN